MNVYRVTFPLVGVVLLMGVVGCIAEQATEDLIPHRPYPKATAHARTQETQDLKSTIDAHGEANIKNVGAVQLISATPVGATQIIATTESQGMIPLRSMVVRRMFPNLKFRHQTNLVQPDDGLGRIFITEQGGVVRVFPNEQLTPEAAIFLDISDRVSEEGKEEGLLGLAFDPHFSENGFFYVYYSAAGPRRSVLSRFSTRLDNPNVASLDSELVILEVEQPFRNHNGGQLAFGPEGFLYIGLGDGGQADDPMGNGQNEGSLLGSILRLDVDGASENSRYRIPASNPFVGMYGARQEIWAYGLRNPWRFSFDTATGQLWAGDVGQNLWEEINLIRKGLNYGWNTMEGFHCFRPNTSCDEAGLEIPVFEYPNGMDCSVIGGYVYRATRLPDLYGVYLYADYCSGKIWGLRYDDGSVIEHRLLVHSDIKQITSFGEDRAGNIFILSRDDGIYQLEMAP